jgi:hypothetical protein
MWGRLLDWFLKPDSLTANADHAIVLAPAIVSIEIFRYEHTYELLITRHKIVETGEGKRPKAASGMSGTTHALQRVPLRRRTHLTIW